jgi:Zn finger protein HypA/HybF involved in hydrogenase expression
MGFELADDGATRKKQAVIVVDEEAGMVECVVCTEPYPSEALSLRGRCVDCRPGADRDDE